MFREKARQNVHEAIKAEKDNNADKSESRNEDSARRSKCSTEALDRSVTAARKSQDYFKIGSSTLFTVSVGTNTSDTE